MRQPRRTFIVLPVVVGGLLLAPPAAPADDAGLFAAYNARQPTDVEAASAEWKRAFRAFKRSSSKRDLRAVMRANRQINEVLTVIEGELAAQAPSSDHGAKAKRHAIREVRGWRRANRYENRYWRGVLRGEARQHRLDRATDEFLRAFRQGKRAVRQFKAVGLSSPLRGITRTSAR